MRHGPRRDSCADCMGWGAWIEVPLAGKVYLSAELLQVWHELAAWARSGSAAGRLDLHAGRCQRPPLLLQAHIWLLIIGWGVCIPCGEQNCTMTPAGHHLRWPAKSLLIGSALTAVSLPRLLCRRRRDCPLLEGPGPAVVPSAQVGAVNAPACLPACLRATYMCNAWDLMATAVALVRPAPLSILALAGPDSLLQGAAVAGLPDGGGGPWPRLCRRRRLGGALPRAPQPGAVGHHPGPLPGKPNSSLLHLLTSLLVPSSCPASCGLMVSNHRPSPPGGAVNPSSPHQ